MAPIQESLPLCLRQFEVGEAYEFTPKPQRSVAAHRYFMTIINEAWHNLPEHLVQRFPTVDRLRYACLVKCGFADEKILVLKTAHDAVRGLELLTELYENVVAENDGNILRIWTAHSQKFENMDGEVFLKTMQPVFDMLSDMLGVSVTELKKNAGRAA
jgi:hypothetical protein